MEAIEIVQSRTHFEICPDVVCQSAGQLEFLYKQTKNHDNDMLFKNTNDLMILMKKNLRVRHSSTCLQELTLFIDRMLWLLVGTVRLYKKLIQMLVLIEKLDDEELVCQILSRAWFELVNSLRLEAYAQNSSFLPLLDDEILCIDCHKLGDAEYAKDCHKKSEYSESVVCYKASHTPLREEKTLDHDQEKVQGAYSEITDCQLAYLSVWSNLIESLSTSPSIVKPQVEWLMCSVSLWLNKHLSSKRNPFEDEQIYAMTKLLLQCCQLSDGVAGFWSREQSFSEMMELLSMPSGDHHQSLSILNYVHPVLRTVSSAIRILCAEDLRKDCHLLAGSLLAFIMSTMSTPFEVLNLSVTFLTSLHCTKDSVPLSCTDQSGILTFGQLSFINGLFAYVNPKVLIHPCCIHATLLHDHILSKENDTSQLESIENSSSELSFYALDSSVVSSVGQNVIKCHSHINDWSCNDNTSSCRPFLLFLFDNICDFCRHPQDKFHSFKLLEIWFKKMMHLTDQGMLYPSGCGLWTRDGTVVKQTLGLLLTHLDDSTDGVSESVSSVIVMLIRLTSLNGSDSGFGLWLLDQALCMPCCVKARYILMSAIMEHLHHDTVLERCHQIMADVTSCLATNYLTPSAVQVYLCIIRTFSKQHSGLELWKDFCWPYVLQSLKSNNGLTLRNASQHLLGATLKTWSAAMTFMLAEAEDDSSESGLYMNLAVLCAGKRLDPLVELPMNLIEKALHHRNNDLRLLAFDLLCVSPRTTDVLKLPNIKLLKNYLPLNMNIDSPPFRKQLQAYLHSALIRARDSSLSKLRQKVKKGEQHSSDEVLSSVEFVDWIWNLCMKSIRPGGSFQRIQTALSWAHTILNTFIIRPLHNARKGVVPADVNMLLSVASEMKLCQFFSKMAIINLMSCLFNEIDEICEMATEIISVYFHWPLTLSVPRLHGEELDFSINDLLGTALRLCHSPRVRDCESGAILCGFVYKKNIIASGDHFIIKSRGDNFWVISTDHSSTSDPAIQFLSQLLDLVELGIEDTSRRTLEAAVSCPIHGLLIAIRQCVSQTSFHLESHQLWQPIIQLIINRTSHLIQLILNIFGGKLTADKTAPSFEQISQAIDDVIGGSSTNEELDSFEAEAAILSPQHQLISTWCWLNIKEACLLLGQLVSVTLGNGKATSSCLLTEEDVNNVGKIFLDVLTRCRHRGAIEGACLGFSKFCGALFNSHDIRIHNVPSCLQLKVLLELNQLSESSVTRRSAGLPLIVQTILANEAKIKQTTLLSQTIESLMDKMLQPLEVTVDQQRDIPQVHAVNILSSIVRESSLAGAVSSYLDRLTVEALKSFSSPVWAMRNASMQLFGYLLCKLVGEKKTVSDELLTSTVSDFILLYPSLCKFALSVLQTAAKQINCTDGHIPSAICDPTLVPILSILARLSQGVEVDGCDEFVLETRELLLTLLHHRLFAVRQLCAKAVVPFVSSKILPCFLQDLLQHLPGSKSEVNSFNNLHGQLLLIKSLISTLHQRAGDMNDLAKCLLSKSWIMLSGNPCPLIRSEFIHVMSSILKASGDVCDIVSSNQVVMELELEFCRIISGNTDHQLGDSVWQSSVVTTWLNSSSPSSISNQVIRCLMSDNPDVLNSCLSWLLASGLCRINADDASAIQVYMWRQITMKRPWKVICDVLKVLFLLYQTHDELPIADKTEEIWDVLMAKISNHPNSTLAAESLRVSSLIIRNWIMTSHLSSSHLTQWVSLVSNTCHPSLPANIRLHVAHALQVAAPAVLHVANGSQYDKEWINAVASLLWTNFLLLNDEEVEIRDISSSVVSTIAMNSSLESSKHQLHYNQAIEVFLDYIAATWSHNVKFSCTMYGHLVARDFVSILSEELKNRYRSWELFQTDDASPFSEHEFLACHMSKVLQEQIFSDCSEELLTWLLHEIIQLELNMEHITKLLLTYESDVLVVRANRKLSAILQLLVCLSNLLMKWVCDALSFFTNSTSTSSSLEQHQVAVKKLSHSLVTFLGSSTSDQFP